MKVLFVSNLYPDAAEPNRGIYNARLVEHLGALCEIRVVSPRPTRGLPPFWSPKKTTPRLEDQKPAPIFPPTGYIPKIGSRWNHKLMARSLRPVLEDLRREFSFDRVLVSWVYPDACAIAGLANEMNFPFIAIAQGSDVHQYLKIRARREIIVSSLNRASTVVTRSQELARLLRDAGLPDEKLQTVYNGVDTTVFTPGDRAEARAALNLPSDEKLLLYVGNLLPIKNPPLLIRALLELKQLRPDDRFRLVLIGEGPLRAELERQIREHDLHGAVSLAGRKPPAEVACHMRAADVLCVSSDNEGVPNVVLEAMACGLRTVATRVGGLPEILTEPWLGGLVSPGDAAGFAREIVTVLSQPAANERISHHAGQYSWNRTAASYMKLLSDG